MDCSNQIYTARCVAAFAFFFLLCNILWKRRMSAKARAAPEPDGAWPFIGHLLMLQEPNLPHIILGAMADKYGPAFTIRLGLHKALVVSSWEIAKECFTVNDKLLATRPNSAAVKIMTYNYAIFGLAPYGAYWREAPKIVILELLSNHRINLLKHVRTSEVSMSIKELYKLWQTNASGNTLVDMKQWFGDLTMNVIVRMVAGKRYFRATVDMEDDEGKRLQKAVRDFFHLIQYFYVVSDALPFLSWLDIGGHEKAMRRTARELDVIMESWLDEHRRNKLAGETNGEQDFMDVLLSKLGDNKFFGYESDVVNKAICLTMILAGTDTTAVTLTWVMSLLLNNRHILKKVQDEIDEKVGKDRQVDESDIEKLVYLQAIVKETMRLYPAGPLSLQHEAINDCTIAGYHLAAGTKLVTNLWKIQRDSHVWPNPCEFQPKRFLTTHANVDVRGQNFKFIPFGSGRRSCPGISLALQVVHLTLARLLQGFELETPLNMAVDMTESAGLTNFKVTPLEVLITPRLSSNQY